MKSYAVIMTIRAECESDAEELIQDYTGKETDVTIKSIWPAPCKDCWSPSTDEDELCDQCREARIKKDGDCDHAGY